MHCGVDSCTSPGMAILQGLPNQTQVGSPFAVLYSRIWSGGGRGRGAGGGDGSGSGSENSGSDSKKQLSEYPGKDLSEIPADKRCCLHFMWVKSDGTSYCSGYNAGKIDGCRCGKHIAAGTPEMRGTKLFAKLKAERGRPNAQKQAPKPPDPAAQVPPS